MAKFAEADARWFHRIFVCRKCKTKQRANVLAILGKRVSCRKCGYKALRVKRKK